MPLRKVRVKFRRRNGKKGTRETVTIKERPRRRPARRQMNMKMTRAQPLQQGVGASVTKAFGGRVCHTEAAMNAFLPQHLPLPRAVGAYLPVRTTKVIDLAKFYPTGSPPTYKDPPVVTLIYSSQASTKDNARRWTNLCAVSSVDATQAINSTLGGAGNAYNWSFETMAGGPWKYSTFVPASVSVQVMNPQALQKTSGIVYGGRINTQTELCNNNQTWQEWANDYISYNNPRLMSAGKLALKGVQADAIPLDMSRLANFCPLYETQDGPFVFGAESESFDCDGFAPIVVVNPDQIPLQLLVCFEWRVRFSPANPAQAAHQHYHPASDNVWAKIVAGMSKAGNGVVDIADFVATHGEQIAAGIKVAGRILDRG